MLTHCIRLAILFKILLCSINQILKAVYYRKKNYHFFKELTPLPLFLLSGSLQSQDVHQIKCFQRKAEVNHEIQQLKSKMRESQVCWFGCSWFKQF